MQADDDMLLRSLQDIVPADLIDAELSETGLEAFTFDSEDIEPTSDAAIPSASGQPRSAA